MSGRTWAILAALLLALPLLAQDKPAGEKPKESRTAYLRRIFEKDRASYGDACRAVLSLIKNEHSDADFAAISGDLAGRGVVRADWVLQEASLLTKGTLAYMVCQALEIKGGVTMRLFGINRRYALRECVQRRLMTSGTVDEYVTGRELIDVITNAMIHKDQGHTDSQYK
jgi:hypothetical protein